ncbi:sulfotransferase domain-containing protein [Sphingopyxis sp. PET50]|uniref:sulfotransferase domain-containing protein n=1 Tax=Sphingopyxis sp. PET50 TaxID=2976533 RepID=UPI0021B05A37|nr:sulfotransferase domain-containing protein [Sphingopyxis sp. PET50]
MARSIVWLASYPKSGNTWLRAMLTHLLAPPGAAFSVNALTGGIEGGDRHALDDACGISSAEMTRAELLPYRALLHRQIAEEVAAPFFIKTHDLYAHAADGTALFPADASRAAVYLVRNPLDVALSFAHHSGHDPGWAIARMADDDATLNVWPDRISDFLPVHLGSWSAHVASWTRQQDIPLCLLRYEDMLADPAAALARVAAIAGIDATPQAIAAAAAASSLAALRAREAEEGFREKPPGMPNFFRSGRAGEWTSALGDEQIARIVATHEEMMAALDYLPPSGA